MFLKESKQDIYEVDYLIDILTALSYSVFSLSTASAAERVQSFPTFASTATKQINNTYIVVFFFSMMIAKQVGHESFSQSQRN